MPFSISPSPQLFSNSALDTGANNSSGTAKMSGFLSNTVEEQMKFGMEILLASLKNQIPGKETNTSEMVGTLMQMTAAIQQARSNELLEKGNTIQSSIYATSLTKLEGDMIEYPGNEFTFNGTSQEILYSFGSIATSVTLNITDATTGTLVTTETLDPIQNKGTFSWDGTPTSGSKVPAGGSYKVSLTVLDKSGNNLEKKLSLNSKITSVSYNEDGQPVLKAGNIEIREISGHKGTSLPRVDETI
jgi:flagellar basal-body rod modification protein FlgD